MALIRQLQRSFLAIAIYSLLYLFVVGGSVIVERLSMRDYFSEEILQKYDNLNPKQQEAIRKQLVDLAYHYNRYAYNSESEKVCTFVDGLLRVAYEIEHPEYIDTSEVYNPNKVLIILYFLMIFTILIIEVLFRHRAKRKNVRKEDRHCLPPP